MIKFKDINGLNLYKVNDLVDVVFEMKRNSNYNNLDFHIVDIKKNNQ